MVEVYDMLMDINPRKLGWTFEVYVVHLWELPSKFKDKEINGIEMTLQDIKARWEDPSFNPQIFGQKLERKNCTVQHRISELLAADKLDDSILIDVIGEVVGKEDPREMITSKGKETKRLAILIEDLENNSIGCVLFGQMVDQILPHLEEEKVELLIIIAQFFRPRRWNGKRLSEKPSGSARISQLFSHGPSSGINELKRGDVVVKTIEEALKSTQADMSAVNVAILMKSLRYKVEVMAYNGTGSITLLMWDREIVQLCGKQADQIKDEVVYTVMKICDDEEIVEINHSKKMHNVTSATITETGYSDSIDMSAVVAIRKNDADSMLSLDGVEDSVTSLKYKTPAKRPSIGTKQALPINLDNEDEMGFSTNKFTRKNGKR
ncbi:hypothetical protein Ahy_A05g023577 [Arachis hypogaea]|uniref:DUF223 domain-containing protein n=1 Tax=Arachis hypogaea TaxID=3818 RepID=A0A445D3W7_ARAHY|nr:hypothetical protein Ahy_A05g023577 [Arachis hypogaea]